MSIVTNIERVGNFNSSEIVALTKGGKRDMTEAELEVYKKENPKGKKTTTESMFGTAALSFIEDCNFERKLGRSITEDTGGRPTSWGNLIEKYLFEKVLGTEYSYNSQETKVHQTIPYWVGSIDGFKHDEDGQQTVVDFKSPATLSSFCRLVEPLYNGLTGMDAMNALRNGYTDKTGWEHDKHPDGEKYFFQLVSNAIISGCRFAELLIFMPTQLQLQEIREFAGNLDCEKPERFYWIANNIHDDEIPHLVPGGYYKSINTIKFEITDEIKDFLTHRVLEAGKKLIPRAVVAAVVHSEVDVMAVDPAIKQVSEPVEETPEAPIKRRKAKGDIQLKNVPPIASNEARGKAKEKMKDGLVLRSKLGKKYNAD